MNFRLCPTDEGPVLSRTLFAAFVLQGMPPGMMGGKGQMRMGGMGMGGKVCTCPHAYKT